MELAISKKNTKTRKGSALSSEKRQNEIQCYICILLPIIGLLVFTLYPMIWAAAKSLYYYTGVVTETRFVGLKNFAVLFKDTGYWSTWITTVEYALIKVPIELFLALIVAVVLNRKMRGKYIYRAVFFMPNLVSNVIVGIVFSNLFGYFGIVNAWLVKGGISIAGIDWFSSKPLAMTVLVAGGIWQSIGVNILYFLSALQNVPGEVYEAADIDGAGTITKFFKITIPMIAPVFQTILLLSINGTLQVNDFILATTNGAPYGSTYSVNAFMTKMYLPGFADVNVNLGYGCAQALITSTLLCLFAVFYNRITKRLENVY